MKISKVFGFVLSLHIAIIATLLIQPGCDTIQPPTQVYQESGYMSPSTSKPFDTLSSTGRLDPAFNADLGSTADENSMQNRSGAEFIEFDPITPKLKPILPESNSPEVVFTGASFKTYTVQKGDSLWAISRRYNCPVNELYAANGLNKNSVLKIGQQIQIPVEGGTGTVKTVTADAYQPSNFKMTTQTYIVKAGDTLSRIALSFDTTVGVIKAANNKTSDMIRVGEELLIPVNGVASLGSSTFSTPSVSASSPALPSGNSSGIHIVKAGEYPATIARQYGIETAELLAINNITNPRTIQVGQRLKVKSGSSTSKEASVPKAIAVTPVSSVVETVEVKQSEATTKASEQEEPVEIRVVEADPLIESEEVEIDADVIFEDAVEIPVIRMEE